MENVLAELMPVAWANQDLILYHGTTASFAGAIVQNGIDVEKGTNFTDFGRGFYTTTSLAQAKKWAGQLARSKKERATVLQFSVSRDDLSHLETLWFTGSSADLENYWSFVFHCRQGNPGHKSGGTVLYYDCVVGPVAAKWQDRMLFSDTDQISFHNKESVTILRVHQDILEI
jgi:hypothetical protein